ncbi:uncharacterized protein AB9W97_013920 [Spinachia spinachia]
MNSCTVIVLVCLLSAEAAPRRTTAAFKDGVETIRKNIKTILGYLDVPGQLPNISCLSLNFTELVVPNQQLFTGQHLSIFRCYILKMCTLTPDLSNELRKAIQNIHYLELHVTKQSIDQDCILPPLQKDMHFNVKCVLKLLDQYLNTTETYFLN